MNKTEAKLLRIPIILFISFFLVLFIAFFSVDKTNLKSETLWDLLQGSRDFGTYIDQGRFPDSLLKRFYNEAQIAIATMGKTNEKILTQACTTDGLQYALPSDNYIVQAIILNPDPSEAIGEQNKWRKLKYVKIQEMGGAYSVGEGRPTQYSVWGDSLFLDVPGVTNIDTIRIYYFALPTDMNDSGSVCDLPDEYIPLIKSYVKNMCIERINFVVESKEATLARIKMLENALLGRQTDEVED